MESGNPRPKITRPPGLRGREIGLYYKKIGKMRREEEEAQGLPPRIPLGPSVIVPKAILVQVEDALRTFASMQKNEEERITKEYEAHFEHLLNVKFVDFIEQSKIDYEYIWENNELLNKRLKSDLLHKEASEEFRCRYAQRQKLPVMKQHDHIMDTIKQNQIVLLVGSTGCGKTTQLPQMILDDHIYNNSGSKCRIVCTQPRRICAVSVAERVAYERFEKLGESVGYQIRLVSQKPRPEGSILYCTTGILLQRMQKDLLMNDFSFVILDEIHERNVETDLLLALLKQILPHRPDLKVILMSATIRENDFCEYFENCMMLRVEGTLFPVKVMYLEDVLQETGFVKFQNPQLNGPPQRRGYKQQRKDAERIMQYNNMIEPYLRQIRDQYDMNVIHALRCVESEGCQSLEFLEYLIFYICEHKPPGAVLVFLPGYDKIAKLNARLQKPTQSIGQRFRNKIQVHALHSLMPIATQQNVFHPTPRGIRKIILSTVIAETSVTIDDVVYVINTGRTKLSCYDLEAKIQTLEETWVTRANSQQRKGRAGRTQPGICYNLFTKAREKIMDDIPTPEILCSRLEGVILKLKLLHMSDVYQFMESLLSCPNPTLVTDGIALLKRIEALDDNETLTPLGVHLARLPIDPQTGKMILMGAIFRCLDPITSAAAGLSYKSPFYTPLGLEKKVDAIKHEMGVGLHSDHLLIDNVILNYRDAVEDKLERDFCYKNHLSYSTLQQLESMKQQFSDLLKHASFINSSTRSDMAANINSHNVPLLRAIIAAGLYPNMAFLKRIKKIKNHVHTIHTMSTPEDRRVNFHPSSVNHGETSFESHFFVYYQKQKSSSCFLLDATMVFPMALIIFGDHIETGYTRDKIFYISVAQAYYFKCNEETATVIKNLRSRLKWLMQKKALYPAPIAPGSAEDHLIKAIQILLSLDEVDDMEDKYASSDEREEQI